MTARSAFKCRRTGPERNSGRLFKFDASTITNAANWPAFLVTFFTAFVVGYGCIAFLLAWLRRVKGDRGYLFADETVRVTVNKQFAEPFTKLDPGDEVGIVPNSPNPPPAPKSPKRPSNDW